MTSLTPSARSLPDTFPAFSNGDVEIVLTPAQKLKLHADVLRGGSSKLSELLAIEHAAILNKKALSEGTSVRHRLELVDVTPTPGGNKIGANGRPISERGAPRASMTLSSHGVDPASRAILSAWFSVFGALYGNEIHLYSHASSSMPAPIPDDDLDVNMDDYELGRTTATTAGADLCDIISAASTILDVVDYLELRSSVLAPLELALLGAEQTLWQSVCAAPLSWIEVGARLRSLPIWREAALHVVGGWATGEWSEQEKGELPAEVRELCARKSARFEAYKERLEERLLTYKHEKLRWDERKDKCKPKKQHEPDVFHWQAQTLWSQWLAARFREGEGMRARDGGFSLYKKIWEGSFCDPVEQAKIAPLVPGGRRRVGKIMDDMKADLKKMVDSIMISKLRLDQTKMQANRLTPFTIEIRNAPWKTKDADHEASDHDSKRVRLEEELKVTPAEEDEFEFEDFIAYP
ncbi:uncharacterized protein LTHEOB_7386 [Lasiodiplodia theobromae]|uniref:uncharacterized protein n=1 Tax=Lasiodiplodia theobromae TaxID=45133 RepID=UPI0015C32B8E|nr:uncharacterized protein LTHEOB_7386 [Lasiodiplodia theobromae]KAF4542656.1 hypothetical protein LTHEOB_7386 [Lasiodiplodia theobromae]